MLVIRNLIKFSNNTKSSLEQLKKKRIEAYRLLRQCYFAMTIRISGSENNDGKMKKEAIENFSLKYQFVVIILRLFAFVY